MEEVKFTKQSIIDMLIEKHSMTKKMAENITNDIFDSMTEALTRGEKVDIFKMFTIQPHLVKERKFRNPKTGEAVMAPEHTGLKVKLSSFLKKLVKDLPKK